MGLIHYMYKLPKSIQEDSAVKFIHSAIRMISSCSFHSSCNDISCEKPKFAHKEMNGDTQHQFGYHQLRFQMSFHKSTHYLERIKFYVEPATGDETPISDANHVTEDAEKICRILSNSSSDANIASSLNKLGVRVSPNLVEAVLKKLSNAGMLALGFFRWAEKKEGFKHTAQSFHHLIEALGKIKQFRLVWSLVESMKQKGLLRKDTFGVITRRYARAKKIREAIDAFDKMEMFGLKPELSDYSSLIDTLSKSKNVERAQVIFNDMKRRKKFPPDLKTYTILLEGWGNERNLPKMNEVYQEMIDEGFTPDVVTYGILINSFCKSGKCDEALKIFHEMEASGCKPSPHIYCSLINGLGSEKRLDEALKFFELSQNSGFSPELPTYNAIVGSYCWVSQFEDAFRVVEEMKRHRIGPNARTYDIILHHLIKSGKKEEAYWVFQKIGREGGCEPQLNTYTMMVSMLCSEERIDLALKVWKEMTDKGVLPCMHMFSALINGLCFENRLDEACSYFKEMLDKGIRPPGQLFGNLKEALLDAGKKDLALELGLELDRLRRRPLNG
nr:pentatricopeptide repeat protein AaPPR1139 [Agave angustifolia]UPT49886.1 pentatricopeptide repeat protein AaPPR1140 [Agave angustifolia]